MQAVAVAEAFDSAQERRARDAAALEEGEQRVGDEAALDARVLAEVGGQLHRSDPIHQPAAPNARPPATLAATSPAAIQASPSSTSRCVSNIQVENVVYAPRRPTPTRSS